MFRHIVLFRVKDGVAERDIESAQQMLGALGALPEVVDWRVVRSLDSRKGVVIIEDATFVDSNGFEEFRARPEHVRAAEVMSAISDWWVGDYVR